MLEVDPKSIAITTTTFYPGWKSNGAEDSVVQVRGNIALNFARATRQTGYQVVVVDGGSSDDFRLKLAEIGILTQEEEQKGMSPSRRQAYQTARLLPGVQVICWTEPEKVSFVRDCLPQAIVPILSGNADVVVPSREARLQESTYPNYQVKFERQANCKWNAILHARNLLPPDTEDLDICFGPKLFRNVPTISDLFIKGFRFPETDDRLLDRIANPELWPNAVTFPVITALHAGKRVTSIEVPYLHPEEQTRIENDSNELRRKRDIQYKNLVVSTIEYIRILENNPNKKGRLVPFNNAEEL